MLDANLLWQGDLGTSAVGDIAMASGTILGQQRVLRRLLTNPGDYIWHPTYGAGLAQFVGATTDALKIKAVIRSQIFLEAAVSRVPEPIIDVERVADGTIYVKIRYVDSVTNISQALSFNVVS